MNRIDPMQLQQMKMGFLNECVRRGRVRDQESLNAAAQFFEDKADEHGWQPPTYTEAEMAELVRKGKQ